MVHNSPLNYRLLVHLLRICYASIPRERIGNQPNTKTQHSLTPCPKGYDEALIGFPSSMLTATPSSSFDAVPRILDAIAAILVNAPRRQSHATGLQFEPDSKQVTLTIFTNAPHENDAALEAYVKGVWDILHQLSCPTVDDQNASQRLSAKLRDVVFAWALPKIQRRLKRFGVQFRIWHSVLEERMKGENWAQLPPFDEPHPEFVEKVAELAREISKAVGALPDIANSNDRYSEVQEIVMLKVPQIIEEIRKIEGYTQLWRRLSMAHLQFNPNIGEWAFYEHFAKIAALATHTNALIFAASSQCRDLFSSHCFTVKIIRMAHPLTYTFPSPPTTQETAQALVDQILQDGDPDNSLKLDRQLIKFHVDLAPKDDESKVVVHSELGLLIHYLKIIVAASQDETVDDETALPFNYIGTSTLQCGFCRTIFRVLEESVLPGTLTVDFDRVGIASTKEVSLKFDTRGAGRRFPRDWAWS
ncbi:hypothetical protein BDN72DRAFT_851135, partial [Pluteus cervinus]